MGIFYRVHCGVGMTNALFKKNFKRYNFFSRVIRCTLKMFHQSLEIPSGNLLILKLFSLKSWEKSLDLDLKKNYYFKSQQRQTSVLFIIVKMLIKITTLSL